MSKMMPETPGVFHLIAVRVVRMPMIQVAPASRDLALLDHVVDREAKWWMPEPCAASLLPKCRGAREKILSVRNTPSARGPSSSLTSCRP
jgi:hypothetical protein